MLGNIMYLHTMKLAEVLAIKQIIDPNRFVKVIKETPVNGGKQGEQYMSYEVVSIRNPEVKYTVNNYLSPYTLTSLADLEKTMEFIKPVIDSSRYNAILSIIKEIKE